MLEALPPIDDPSVLVGFNTADDAGVVKLSDDLALIQTVDVFTPVVDDAYNYGQIAAANSISDVYAMGGKPICALNIMGFPQGDIDMSIMIDILLGACDKAKEAGIPIVGGHTIKDKELKYGLSVTGIVHPDRVITNAGAEVGDRLYLTKPLGSGIISTALRAGRITDDDAGECIEVMCRLNRVAAEAMIEAEAHAATDITGFGLLGHAWEVAQASGIGMVIHFDRVPILDRVMEFIEKGTVPGGSMNNKMFLEEDNKVKFADRLTIQQRIALCDAQTSGGLLVALAPDKVETFKNALSARGEENSAFHIGEIIEGEAGKIEIC